MILITKCNENIEYKHVVPHQSQPFDPSHRRLDTQMNPEDADKQKLHD
jgi:hypothetical protein